MNSKIISVIILMIIDVWSLFWFWYEKKYFQKQQRAKSRDDRIAEIQAEICNDLEQKKWLMDYRFHQENILYNRANFFLFAISMFFVAFTTVPETNIAIAIAITGMLITILWAFAVKRQQQIVSYATQILKKGISVYAGMSTNRFKPWISGKTLVNKCVPFVIVLAWHVLILLRLID